MKPIFSTAILSFIIIIWFAADITAIPAFARKYNMSCKTCHSPVPYLKKYGDDFAGNGFQLKDKESPRYYVETGDDRLNLIRDLPLAVRIQGFITYNEDNNYQWDAGSPSSFKLLSGGAISKDVSYYAYYILENGEPGKIEDAWLMFNNLFGAELDFTIGQFQVCDPVFKRELRLTNEDYMVYKARPGNSQIDLTYDRGIFFAYSLPEITDLTIEIVNGSGIGEVNPNNLFDEDKYKNAVARLSRDFGDHFRIGALGYYGNEMINVNELEFRNELWMAGGDATVSFDVFELNIQYLYREDKNPYGIPDNQPVHDTRTKVVTDGGFAELIYRPMGDESTWYAAAIYNTVKFDDPVSEIPYDYQAAALQGGYLLMRNIRLIGEAGYDIKNESGKFAMGFVTAF
jgi:hypothetical protein